MLSFSLMRRHLVVSSPVVMCQRPITSPIVPKYHNSGGAVFCSGSCRQIASLQNNDAEKTALHQQRFKVRQLTATSQVEKLNLPPVASTREPRTWEDFLRRASQLPLSHELKERVLLYASSVNLPEPVVDIIDARDRGFRVITTEGHHPIDGKRLGQLIETLLGKDSDAPFHLYFMVCSSSKNDKFARFTAQPIEFRYEKKKQKDGSERLETLADYCSLTEDEIRRRTTQRALRLSTDPEYARRIIYARIKTLSQLYGVDMLAGLDYSIDKETISKHRPRIPVKAKRQLEQFFHDTDWRLPDEEERVRLENETGLTWKQIRNQFYIMKKKVQSEKKQ